MAALSEPVIPLKETAGTGFLLPEHEFRSGAPIIPMGDPTNLRNRVYDGDSHTQGKPWGYPRHHVNHYLNIRGINAVQERFFGRIVSKIRYRLPDRSIAGAQSTFKTNVNLQRPPSVPYGDFATYVADGTERIGGRTGWR